MITFSRNPNPNRMLRDIAVIVIVVAIDYIDAVVAPPDRFNCWSANMGAIDGARPQTRKF